MRKFLTALVFMLVLAGCSTKENDVPETTVNNGGNDIMEGYSVPTTNQFIRPEASDSKASYNELMGKLESREPGVYYVGYTGCPWCQKLVPVLNTALAENDTTAYYIDVKSGEWADIAARFEEFQKSLPEAQQSGGFVPYVVFIGKDGNIKGHVGTIQADNSADYKLSDDEIDYLRNMLSQNIAVTK